MPPRAAARKSWPTAAQAHVCTVHCLTIADGIYFGSPHILAKFPRNYNDITAGGVNIHIPLTPEQEAANRVISHDRQRIEHVIGMINRHQLFRRPWAGGVLALVNAMHVTCHLTNIKTKMAGINATPQNGYSRYADLAGPWPHDGHAPH